MFYNLIWSLFHNIVIIALYVLQASTVIIAGLGMAAIGFAGRYILKQIPNASTKFTEAIKNLPKFDAESLANSKYYKGGFEPKMTKREAALILGVSPTANKAKVCIIQTHSHILN